MHKRICITALLWMAAGTAFSQDQIRGKIIDALTHQPLQGVTVADLQDEFSTVSNRKGNFSLPGNKDTVRFTCVGYASLKRAAEDSPMVVLLTPLFDNLDEVIVSGNRELQKRTEVPVAIDVITKKQINDTKATRLDQLVNQVPGVFMVDLGNEQHSMSVRQPLGYQSLFLYLEDGIPIRTIGDFNHNALIEINQAALQRIEVIKGPASSLYGSDAVGGALNFISQPPAAFLKGKVQAETGTRGYQRTDMEISNTYKKMGFYLGGYYAAQHQEVNEHNDFNKAALTFRTDYHFNDQTRLVTVADYINYKTDQKGGLDSLHFYQEDYTSQYRFTYRKVDAFRVRSTLSRKWNENNHSLFTIYYRNTSVGQNPFYYISDLASDPSKASGQVNKDAFSSYGMILQHSKEISRLHTKWIIGLSADYSPVSYLARYILIDKNTERAYYRYQTGDSVLTDYEAPLFNTAAYTQIEYNPVKKLRVVLAARYDRLDYRFNNHLPSGAYSGAPDAINHFDHFTPKLGLTYDFGNHKGAYVNYSVGFAPPDISDLYTGVRVPVLEPSSYKNYEAGGWLSFAENKGYAEASIYRMDGTNEIVNVRLPDGSYQNQNVGRTSHQGIELTIRYVLAKDLQIRLGGTIARHRYQQYEQQGKNLSGNEMAQSPSYIMNSEISWKPHYLKGFRISLENQSMGSYFTDPQNTSRYGGFVQFNARAGYTYQHFEVWANCINLTNQNYAVTVEKSGYGTSYRPGQLQTLNIGLAYHFSQP